MELVLLVTKLASLGLGPHGQHRSDLDAALSLQTD